MQANNHVTMKEVLYSKIIWSALRTLRRELIQQIFIEHHCVLES